MPRASDDDRVPVQILVPPELRFNVRVKLVKQGMTYSDLVIPVFEKFAEDENEEGQYGN